MPFTPLPLRQVGLFTIRAHTNAGLRRLARDYYPDWNAVDAAGCLRCAEGACMLPPGQRKRADTVAAKASVTARKRRCTNDKDEGFAAKKKKKRKTIKQPAVGSARKKKEKPTAVFKIGLRPSPDQKRGLRAQLRGSMIAYNWTLHLLRTRFDEFLDRRTQRRLAKENDAEKLEKLTKKFSDLT